MKPNIIFLIIGLILSIISKFYHFKFKSLYYIGNIVVIPAATFFCLAVLFSIEKYNLLFFTLETRPRAILLAVLACGTVAALQLMMISFVSSKLLYGFIFSIPFIILLILFIRNWL
jgi:hypothetical protein